MQKVTAVKIFQHFLHANFFVFILSISDHTVFLVQFGIICTCELQKAENCTRRSGSCNFSFLKKSLLQINSKLNSKLYDDDDDDGKRLVEF